MRLPITDGDIINTEYATPFPVWQDQEDKVADDEQNKDQDGEFGDVGEIGQMEAFTFKEDLWTIDGMAEEGQTSEQSDDEKDAAAHLRTNSPREDQELEALHELTTNKMGAEPKHHRVKSQFVFNQRNGASRDPNSPSQLAPRAGARARLNDLVHDSLPSNEPNRKENKVTLCHQALEE